MKRYQTRFVKSTVCRLGAALSSLILMAGAGLAQQGPGDAGQPGTINPKAESQQRQRSEFRLRNPEITAASEGVNQTRVLAAIELVKHDFERIQIIRNELIDDLVAKKPLNYKQVAEQTGEINKRANRLKTFLMPPVPEKVEKELKEQVEYNNEELKGALVKLCNLIFRFINNPVLKTPDVVDVEQSTKAGGDLLSIIEISDNIKRNAERLKASK
jgi:hypothetical protein